MIILDRQMVLETLYDHVKDKSKVLMNKRVVSVINSKHCVEVKTDDGCPYTRWDIQHGPKRDVEDPERSRAWMDGRGRPKP